MDSRSATDHAATEATPVALQRAIDRLSRRIAQLEVISRRYGLGRLLFVLAAAGASFATFQWGSAVVGWLVVLVGVVTFFVIAHYHDRVEASLTRHRLARRIKRQHAARTRLNWSALPAPLAESPDAEHPFGADLNLIGERSLHHLLDATASLGGSRRLREWLLAAPGDATAIRHRQCLVRALVPRSGFRDRLTLLSLEASDDPNTRWDDAVLRTWLERRSATPALKSWVVGLTGFALLNIGLIAGHIIGALPPLWPFTIAAYYATYAVRYRSWAYLFDEARDLEQQLERFAPALTFLERTHVTAEAPLGVHLAPLQRDDRQPSQHLRRLERIAAAASYTQSELLWVLLNTLLPWELLLTFLLDRTKGALRAHLPEWLDVWYDLEALNALASYADYHPACSFPEITDDSTGPPVLVAEALGHPLLPEHAKVRNDFRIDALGAVVLVTGSNMSGKSTFLRTIGINLVLVFAGGPVDAARLSTRVFRLFTCLNVSDSVQDGLSYFYAEVRRLKALLEALRTHNTRPLFFLIDEIFRGTNNRERLLGSQAYVRTLADAHGVGLISTHDLELVGLASSIASMRNVHFREEITDGRMTFDYTLHPGPCPTTNALTIMHQTGLPVDRPTDIPHPTTAPNYDA